MDLIQKLEQEEIARLARKIPDFAPGDTVIVKVQVVEGDKKREQAYEGVVIAKRNKGLNSSFIVRKISSGEGVERTFQTYSPAVASIEVKRRGDVRRAKLYYLRDRSGKSARIREKLTSVADREVLPPVESRSEGLKPPRVDAEREGPPRGRPFLVRRARLQARRGEGVAGLQAAASRTRVRNQRTRCADVPCVNDSGTTCRGTAAAAGRRRWPPRRSRPSSRSPGSRMPALALRAMRPHAREAVGLQLRAHRQAVASAPGSCARAAVDLGGDAQELLHVVADLVRDHVGLREIARRVEALAQVAVEGEVDVDLLVAGAVERPHRRLPRAARRGRRAREEHELRPAVLRAARRGRCRPTCPRCSRAPWRRRSTARRAARPAARGCCDSGGAATCAASRTVCGSMPKYHATRASTIVPSADRRPPTPSRRGGPRPRRFPAGRRVSWRVRVAGRMTAHPTALHDTRRSTAGWSPSR